MSQITDRIESQEVLRKERLKFLVQMGISNVQDIGAELQAFAHECLFDLEDAVENLPPPQVSANKSHNSNATKAPSQKFGHIEIELREFHSWFSGGRKPRGRDMLSRYSLKLMLGEKPFGSSVLVLERGLIPPRADVPRDLDWTLIERIEPWSEQNDIGASQFQSFITARGKNGGALWGHVAVMPQLWPAVFLHLVAEHRDSGNGSDIPVRLLTTRLTDQDRARMAGGISVMIEALAVWRRNQDRRHVMTIARWASREPIFKLVNRAITLVWPLGSGRTLPRRHVDKLMANLVLDLQALVDSRANTSQLFRHYGYPRSVLGGELTGAGDREHHLEGRVQKIVTFVDRLRIQHAAYYWARHTASAILITAQEKARETGNADLRAACNVVSGSVISALDEQMNLRRNLLDFGGDRPQGELFKWFGRSNDRVSGSIERAIANLVLPVIGDKFDFLDLLTRLIAELHLGKQAVQSWDQVAVCANGAGRHSWEITPKDSSGYLEAAYDAGLGRKNMFAIDFR